MTDKTQTEDNSALDELRAQIDALKTKNQELIKEKQAAKKAADDARDAAEEAANEAASKSGDVEAIKAAHTKELGKLQKQLEERDNTLRTISVDNAIAQQLAGSNVHQHATEPLTALFKSKAEFKDGVATVDGQPIADFVKAYLSSDIGAHYVRANDNTGGGATGAGQVTATRGYTKDSLTLTEFSKLAAGNPAEANAIATAVGASWRA